MAATSIRLACLDLTTIDNIDHAKRTMYLAVLVNTPIDHDPITSPSAAVVNDRSSTRQYSIPRRLTGSTLDMELTTIVSSEKHTAPSEKQSVPWQGTITYPLYTNTFQASSEPLDDEESLDPLNPFKSPPPPPARQQPPPRTFAILRTTAGKNPWDKGLYGNFTSVMGDYVSDWFLPLRYSPCCDHDRGDSFYEFGGVVSQMTRDAGLSPFGEQQSASLRKYRRQSRKKSSDSQMEAGVLVTRNGEIRRVSKSEARFGASPHELNDQFDM